MLNKPVSILSCAGRKFYRLHEFIEEAEDDGISKRIPLGSIPEGLVPGRSKIFIAHPDAIVKVNAPEKTLRHLAWELVEAGVLTQVQYMKLVDLDNPYWTGEGLNSEDFVPECMLDITFALSILSEQDLRGYNKLVREFELKFCMGVIGWSVLQGVQYIAKKDEDDLPPELQHYRGLVTPVRVTYTEYTEMEDEDE